MNSLALHWPLPALLVLAGALRVLFFTGLLGSDDTAYAENAIAMLDGSFRPAEDMTTMRIALDAVAAVSFAVLGVSELSLGAPALGASLLTLAVVYTIASLLSGRLAAIIAGTLYVLSPLNILSSSALLPEVPMGLCVALAILLFLLGLRAAPIRAAVPLALLSGVAVGLGYLVKEPAALVIGAFALAGLVRIASGDRAGWLYALPICGFALVFAIETAAHFAATGEFLHRFRAIAQHQAVVGLRSEQERRLQSFWLYPRNMFFVLNQVGLLFYLLIGVGAVASVRRWRTPLLLVFWLVIPFLYLEFGSTSLTSYNALPKQPRYLEALTAPAVILLGIWLAEWFRSPGVLARRAAYGFLGLYALTSPVFTTISFVDRQATTQPIRVVASFLADSRLQPLYATSIIANGLSLRSDSSSTSQVSRVCLGCVAGPCASASRGLRGEVWAVPRAFGGAAVPPVTDCPRWRPEAEVPVPSPPIHRQAVQSILWLADRLPMPHAVQRELRPLRDLLEPRFVTVYVPSEVP